MKESIKEGEEEGGIDAFGFRDDTSQGSNPTGCNYNFTEVKNTEAYKDQESEDCTSRI